MPRPMRPQKPPTPRQPLERLHITRGLLAALLAVLALLLKPDRPAPQLQPEAAVVLEPAEPLQEWATDAGTPLRYVGPLLLGQLPSALDNQRKAPCDPDMETEVEGACWIALKKPPPCPAGKAWEKDGVCYSRSLRAERAPTSGGTRPVSIADPP